MKRNIFTLIVLCFISGSTSAQLFSFGPTVGFNTSTMTHLLDDGQSRSALFGFSGGISTRLRFEEIYLLTELNFEQKGYYVKHSDNVHTKEKMQDNYIELPVILRYNTFSTVEWNGFLEGGFYVATLMKSTLTTSSDTGGSVKKIDLLHPDINILYTTYDIGIVVGGGVMKIVSDGAGEIGADLRVSYGFIDAIQYTGTASTVRSVGSDNFSVHLGLCYYFNNFDKEKHIRMKHGPYY